jgi:Uma2 family endonuclease
MATVQALMTAEEFGDLPDSGRRLELVRGRVIALPPPNFDHGYCSVEAAHHLRAFVKERDLGWVVANDSGVITQRNPDSVRGADVAFYSYNRIPKGFRPKRYPTVAPEIVIEVKSPSDRWREILEKVAEYLAAGVLIVCVLDPETTSARLYFDDRPHETLADDDELTFPGVLPDFRVRVGTIFE